MARLMIKRTKQQIIKYYSYNKQCRHTSLLHNEDNIIIYIVTMSMCINVIYRQKSKLIIILKFNYFQDCSFFLFFQD
eukprot:UN10790